MTKNQDNLIENTINQNYLGFANLQNNAHRKSTLINSLFQTKLYRDRELSSIDIEQPMDKSIKMSEQHAEVEERNVKLKLTVVDALNFGESINAKDSIDPIIRYIDEQFEKYLEYEHGLNRRQLVDTRVHACFYFISPIGNGLKPIDIQFFKELSTRVNIIPVIAKSDCLTVSEKEKLKKLIIDQLKQHDIKIYTIPSCDQDEEPAFVKQMNEIKNSIPFAICSSMDKVEVDGRATLGREYPFGTVDIMDSNHSDFLRLRTMLVTYMQDLCDVTNELHYENFRSAKLASGYVGNDTISITNSFHEDEKDKKLREKEDELRKLQEMIEKMQMQIKLKTESQLAN